MNQKTTIRQLKALEKNGGKPMRLAAEGWDAEWKTLVAIILSARTRDETTIEVCKELFAKYGEARALATASAREVAEIIRRVNFYKNKTKNIIACARVLVEHFMGVPPQNIDELINLPGVGRKTANVFLAEYGADAIGVDTHVSYISQKLGWTQTSAPHKIEKDLEALFPRALWRVVNRTLVRFGKSHTSRREKDRLLDSISKM